MAANPVEGELLLQNVETYQRKLAELGRQVKDHPERLPAVNYGLQELIDGKGMAPLYVADQYADIRKIKGLVFMGLTEWEKAMTSRGRRNRNPLSLEPSWCPHPELQYPLDQLKKLVELCRTPEWNTTPILYLALPEVAGTPTSLAGQYSWWGVQHDSLGPGSIRKDVFWSNWFQSRDETWKDEPAVTEPTWMIGFDHPLWTTGKNWSLQQEAAAEHGMTIATAAQDTLMLNLRLASAGKRLRAATWSRTCTVYGGYPLLVYSCDYGVSVYSRWDPQLANGYIAASVQGMPSEIAS